MSIWTIFLAAALQQSDSTPFFPEDVPDDSGAPSYVEPYERLPLGGSKPTPGSAQRPNLLCPGCPTCPHEAPMFSFGQPAVPSAIPAPVAAVAAPTTAIVAPVSPYWRRGLHSYGAYPVVAVTPYSFERYPIYTYPCLPHKFYDLRVRSKWRLSPGNMFPTVDDQPAAHGYYYFRPYNYGMVPYQQYASQRWGQPASQPYLGPLQDELAARAASFHSALSGHSPAPGRLIPQPEVSRSMNTEQDAASAHFRQQSPINNSYSFYP